MKYLLPLLAVFTLFLAGYFTGKRSVNIERIETVRVDTVFYEKPQPTRVLPPAFASVRVHRMLFAPGDTTVRTVAVNDARDSMEVQIAVERRQYGDSTYRAQISGPAIGRMHPELDWIEIYSRTNTVTQTITKRSRFAVTAGVGGAYTPQGFQPYAGVGVGIILWQW